MTKRLDGRRIAALAADGVEQIELTEPACALTEAGASVELVALAPGSIQGVTREARADRLAVARTVAEVSADDFDGLVLPGGRAHPDDLSRDAAALQLVRDVVRQDKAVAAIGHGPWMLAGGDVVRDRRVTSDAAVRADLERAGAEWLDAECVVDGVLVTSRGPGDLRSFCAAAVEVLAACAGAGAEAG